MLSETQYHQHADATLQQFIDALEPAYESGQFEELELMQGVLTIATASGKQFVISKHAPSQQLWLASPFSGGLHFSLSNHAWQLADGRTLHTILAQDLAQAGVKDAL